MCMANFEQMQNSYSEDDFDLRSKDSHNYHLQRMEDHPTLRGHYSREYGINGRSALEDAPFCDVTEQLPQDAMHIILEGALSRSLFFLVTHYIDNDIFTLKQLNNFIENFNYGYAERKDKPVAITKDDLEKSADNLGQQAVQLWELARIFPLFASRFVDVTSSKWKMYMTMLEITGIALSKTITINIIGYLRLLIKEHLFLFHEEFGDIANITPKQHYLVHLPTQILKFGPLVRNWVLRFEAKHQYFKRIAHVIRNFKNLPKSFAHRHQNMVVADSVQIIPNVDEHPLFKNENTTGRSQFLIGEALESTKQLILRFYPTLVMPELLWQTKSITFCGILYKHSKEDAVLAEFTDGTPTWGIIKKIVTWDEQAFLVLELLQTNGFDASIGCYVVEKEAQASGLFVINVTDLLCPSVSHIYKHNSNLYILPREDPATLSV